MSIQKGDKIPSATFMTPGADGPEPIDTNAIFNGKRVALFAVPGAFTPTCSAKHLPGFKEQAELDAKGFGMGSRSQRYAMVVNDGTVENVFVEEGGEFKVSSADYLLENL